MQLKKSLSVDPDDRFQTANELKSALINSSDFSQNTWERLRVSPPPVRDLLQSKETAVEREPSKVGDLSDIASSNGSQPVPSRPAKKRRSWVSLILLAAIIIILGGTYYLRPDIPSENRFFDFRLYKSDSHCSAHQHPPRNRRSGCAYDRNPQFNTHNH